MLVGAGEVGRLVAGSHSPSFLPFKTYLSDRNVRFPRWHSGEEAGVHGGPTAEGGLACGAQPHATTSTCESNRAMSTSGKNGNLKKKLCSHNFQLFYKIIVFRLYFKCNSLKPHLTRAKILHATHCFLSINSEPVVSVVPLSVTTRRKQQKKKKELFLKIQETDQRLDYDLLEFLFCLATVVFSFLLHIHDCYAYTDLCFDYLPLSTHSHVVSRIFKMFSKLLVSWWYSLFSSCL
jgi:hypothetical protein